MWHSPRSPWRSDDGSPHAGRCTTPTAAPHTRDLIVSMSRPGNCWDNAAVESFFSTLKQEAGDRWATHADAASAIGVYIEEFYNPVRLHSTLGYQPPVAFEEATSR